MWPRLHSCRNPAQLCSCSNFDAQVLVIILVGRRTRQSITEVGSTVFRARLSILNPAPPVCRNAKSSLIWQPPHTGPRSCLWVGLGRGITRYSGPVRLPPEEHLVAAVADKRLSELQMKLEISLWVITQGNTCLIAANVRGLLQSLGHTLSNDGHDWDLSDGRPASLFRTRCQTDGGWIDE